MPGKGPVLVFMETHGGKPADVSLELLSRGRELADALGVPLGLSLARIGCYMKGCCWGTPIPEGHPFYGAPGKLIRNSLVTLHPVQLYSAAAALAIFGILLAVRRRWKAPGLLTALFMLLYAAARFSLEFFRGDTPALFGRLTLYQGICILLFSAGICLCLLFVRKTDEGPRTPATHTKRKEAPNA